MAYTAVEPVIVEFIDELRRLQKELAQARLDAEIYETMYDTKRVECKELRTRLEIARAAMERMHAERIAIQDEANWRLTRVILQRNLARQSRNAKEDELVYLREELTQSKLDADLLVKLGQSEIFEAWHRLLAVVDI